MLLNLLNATPRFIHSLGYEKYLVRLYKKLDLRVGTAKRKEWISKDKRRSTQQLYNDNDEVRVRNAQRRYVKMSEELKKLEDDWKSMRAYKSGMAGPGMDGDEDKDDRCCPYCGGSVHKTRRSKKCKVSTNPTSKYYEAVRSDCLDDTVEDTF